MHETGLVRFPDSGKHWNCVFDASREPVLRLRTECAIETWTAFAIVAIEEEAVDNAARSRAIWSSSGLSLVFSRSIWSSTGRNCSNCTRSASGTLAPCQEQSALCGALQCLLQIARSSVPVRSALAQLLEPPWYGPVCQVVWEGRSREAPLARLGSPLSRSIPSRSRSAKVVLR